MDKDKIVISGIGSISPFGYTLEDFWKGIIGQYQIDTIFTDYDTFLNVPSIKEIIIQKWNPESILEKKGLKYMTKSTQLLLSSAVLSHQKDDFYADTEIGVTVATNFSGVQPVSEYDYTILTEGPQYVSPMSVSYTHL